MHSTLCGLIHFSQRLQLLSTFNCKNTRLNLVFFALHAERERGGGKEQRELFYSAIFLAIMCRENGNSGTTFISSLIHAAFFHKLLQYSSLNIYYRKRLVLRFSKCSLPFLYPQRSRRFAKFVQISIYLINQNCLNI